MAKTKAQWVAEALAEMEKATWPPSKWATKIETDPDYNWAGTHNFKAQQAMWNAVHPAPNPAPTPTPPPEPPTPPGHPVGNRCLYFSTVDDDTVQWVASLGRRFGAGLYTALFSADLNLAVPGKSYWITDAQVSLLTSSGITVASWSDCSATPYSHAVTLAKRPGFAYAGGQAEDEAQYLQAIRGGANHIIGNPNNLGASLSDAINRTSRGEIAFIGEILHPDPGYSAQGVNVSSGAMYVDMDEEHGGYQPLASFEVMPAGWKPGASIYTPGVMRAADRALYEQWTKP